MKNLLQTIKYGIIYTIKTTFYGWKVVYQEAHKSWAIMKDDKIYCLDTRESCYEYVCLA